MQLWVCKYTNMQAHQNPQFTEDRTEKYQFFLKLDFLDFLKFNQIVQRLLTLLSLVKTENNHICMAILF